jgi:hypothetical protein
MHQSPRRRRPADLISAGSRANYLSSYVTSAPSILTRGGAHGGTERERHAAAIAAHGRMAWQKAHGYGLRSLGETAISRLKRQGGDRLT